MVDFVSFTDEMISELSCGPAYRRQRGVNLSSLYLPVPKLSLV
jgi:hypothetical protein